MPQPPRKPTVFRWHPPSTLELEPNNARAKAWQRWIDGDGKALARLETLTPGPFLQNRLWQAFGAGYQAAQEDLHAAATPTTPPGA